LHHIKLIVGAFVGALFFCIIPFQAASAAQEESGYFEAPFGDLILRLPGRRPPPESRRWDPATRFIHPDEDPRFRYIRPLEGLFVRWRRGERRPELRDFEALATSSEAESSPFDVPPTMTAFRHPQSAGSDIVRLDDTLLFGQRPYFQCLMLTSYGYRKCDLHVRVSDETTLTIILSDHQWPPEEWPALLASLEAGFREMIVSQ
jgi:hypothetical protein